MHRTFRSALVAALLMAGVAVLADAQAVGRRVKVNGMQMYYEVSGTGAPLIVLHGAYMNIPAMGAIIPKLAKTHRVYALELQGHGRTTDIDRPITYPNLADDVDAFMEAVGLQKADVFGYSMGAVTGLQGRAGVPGGKRTLRICSDSGRTRRSRRGSNEESFSQSSTQG
jgi:pimeloyl-ACP methyl ester carboxylesterase